MAVIAGRKIHKPKQRMKPIDDGARAEEQLTRLLIRLRLSVPFPVEPEAFVRTLLPDLLSPAPAPEQLANLHLALSMRQFVHVSLDDEGDFDKGDYENVFWLRVPNAVPTPPDLLQPFRLWPENPYWKQVSAWHSKAGKLDGQIAEITGRIGKYFKLVTTAAELRCTWPELLKFVRLRGPTLAHIPPNQKAALKDVLQRDFTPQFKELALQLFASATMLEADAEPNAWVSFHSE